MDILCVCMFMYVALCGCVSDCVLIPCSCVLACTVDSPSKGRLGTIEFVLCIHVRVHAYLLASQCLAFD